jgi:23S rRNA-/tRNA-specific pseudouridylate synthase
VARNQKTFVELKRKFADREIEKNYVALVYGHLEKKSGVVDAPIARSASFKKQKIAYGKIKGTARPAMTEYKLLKRYKGFDFVEALPKTGRMHQIRVHLAYLGHPIVGDAKYKRKDLILPKGVSRQLLHAQKLKFELWGKKYSFKAKLPKDFEAFIRSLDEKPIKR